MSKSQRPFPSQIRAPLARQDTEFLHALQLPQIEEEAVQPARDETLEMVPLVPPQGPTPSPAPVVIPSIRINDMPAGHRRTNCPEEKVELRAVTARAHSQLGGVVGQVVPLMGQLLGGLPPLPPHERNHLHRYVSMPIAGSGGRRSGPPDRRTSERQELLENVPEERTIEEDIIVPQEATRLGTSKLDRFTRLVRCAVQYCI